MLEAEIKLDKVIVVKIGSVASSPEDTSIDDIVALQKQGKRIIVTHGGGKLITEWLEKQGVTTRFIRGERVTDQASLEVVIAVLCGLVNKEIVSSIQNRGGQAVGISGIDGGLIQASIKNAELGYVGKITKVNTAPLEVLLEAGYIPVVSPISLHPVPEAREMGLNINADDVAGEIATAIRAEKLIFLTDVIGICDQSGSLIPHLSPDEAEALTASGVASGGMIPKIRACLSALASVLTTSIIDGRQPYALLNEIERGGVGTTIGA